MHERKIKNEAWELPYGINQKKLRLYFSRFLEPVGTIHVVTSK